MNPLSMRLSRREVLCRIGGGFGALGLASVCADLGRLPLGAATVTGAAGSSNPLAPRTPHFPARAKRVIFLFMNGAPSHVDTFDPKPELAKHAGEAVPESLLQKTGRKGAGKLMASPFKSRPCGQSGIEVSEIYPDVGPCIDEI